MKNERISLYNHNFIDSDGKPIIPNMYFKNLCEGIKSGEITDTKEYFNKYSFVNAQISLIEYLLEQKQNGQKI